jgi:hypothetical protein
VTAFVELPEQCRRFLDLYRGILNEVPLDTIAPLLLSDNSPQVSEDLRRAARALVHGGPEQRDLARDWLLAGRPQLRELRNATAIGSRIEDDVRATEVLSNLISALGFNGVRTVILIDEFQRIAGSPARQREAILVNLRSVFSRNPAYLSVVLAVTTRIEKSAMDLLPRELRTLMGMRPTISLPEMNEDEAERFILDRFRFFRPPGYCGDAAAPLGLEAIRAVIAHVAAAGRERLIPRTILQATAWLYDEVPGGDEVLSRAEADRLLDELTWDDQ